MAWPSVSREDPARAALNLALRLAIVQGRTPLLSSPKLMAHFFLLTSRAEKGQNFQKFPKISNWPWDHVTHKTIRDIARPPCRFRVLRWGTPSIGESVITMGSGHCVTCFAGVLEKTVLKDATLNVLRVRAHSRRLDGRERDREAGSLRPRPLPVDARDARAVDLRASKTPTRACEKTPVPRDF